MAFRPTNMFCRLNESFAYDEGAPLCAEQLRRALSLQPSGRWTRALLLPGFAADDVAVKLEGGDFFVDAVAESRLHPGDFTRVRRRIRLPGDVDADTTRCWMENDALVLQADAPPELATQQQQQLQQQQHAGLVDVGAGVVKDKAAGATRWRLDLPMPEFDAEEVSVEKLDGRVVIVAEHSAASSCAESKLSQRRELTPPTGVQLDLLAFSFDDGVLRLDAPAPGLKPQKRHSRIATLTRDIRQGPHFQEKPHCTVC